MRHALWYLIAGLAFGGVLLLGLKLRTLYHPDRGITMAAFWKIQPGMTLKEVEQIIGRPPDPDGYTRFNAAPGLHPKVWRSDRYGIVVFFKDQRVDSKCDSMPDKLEEPSTIENIISFITGIRD
jgi:hypothetical protein